MLNAHIILQYIPLQLCAFHLWNPQPCLKIVWWIMSENPKLKGTVAWDFFVAVFFIKRHLTHREPSFIPSILFLFGNHFTEILLNSFSLSTLYKVKSVSKHRKLALSSVWNTESVHFPYKETTKNGLFPCFKRWKIFSFRDR